MRRLIQASVRRPVAVAMLYLAVGLLAAAAWANLPVEVIPTGEYPEVTVSTSWPGGSPEAVQALITSPIEALAASLPGVRHVRSTSERGSSRVTVEFGREVNLDLAVFELTDRLALLRPGLPPGAAAPRLVPYVPPEFSDLQGGPFISFMLRAPRSLNELRALAKEGVVDALAEVEGVGEVAVVGGADPHLRVTLDPELCRLYGVEPAQVLQALGELDRTWPVGRLELNGTAYTVRLEHAVPDLAPLRRLPVGRVGETLVRLEEVGRVEAAYEAVDSYSRVNGEPRVTVDVSRKPGTDVLTVARAVRTRIAALQDRLPTDVRLEMLQDQAADLEAELALVGRRLALVLVLVVVLLVVLLRDLRSPAFLFASVAASLALTVVALYHLQVPINVLTLTGLALAFGMLVDNAVVVLENVVRHREAAAPPATAATAGTAEVLVPVLAATLTTVAVFFPFVYFQGRLRDYYMPLALAIAFALSASLLVALTLMPAAAARGWVARSPRLGRTPGRRYRRAIGWSLAHPWLVLLLVAGAGYGSYRLFDEHVAKGGFYSWWARDRIWVRVSLPQGAEPVRADEAIAPFEEYLLRLPDVERVETRVVRETASLTALFPPELERTAYPLLVKDELIAMATRYAGVRIVVAGFDPNSFSSGFAGSTFYSSGIKLLGYNYRRLGEIAGEIRRTVLRSPRVREAVVTSGSAWRPADTSEVILRVRRERLSAAGLTVDDLLARLRALLAGPTGQERLRVGPREWELRLKFAGAEERSLGDLLAAKIAVGPRREVRVGELVDVAVEPLPGAITREDQRYERWVRWEYRGSSRAAEAYQESIFQSLELPPGYSAELRQPFRLTAEERQQIRLVAGLALVLVFMVLASLYESLLQPFIVLLTVPCALIGVFLTFYLTGRPFDASASVGVVLLSGIVVNNAIILVDHVNLLRRGGLGMVDAVTQGAAERVRPILITSLTTIGGLLPLVLIEPADAATGRHDIWANLALATIGGLAAATLLTLGVTPVLYALADRARATGRRLLRRLLRVWYSLPAQPGSS